MISRPIHDIEAKWQNYWLEQATYQASDRSAAAKFYGLIEFPYPSGEGMHVGHGRPFIGGDVVCRQRRMRGDNVMFPIGWDAFGLPTENFAIKHKIKPQQATERNVKNFIRQSRSLGLGFDWSREINTTDPAYYRWTQWQFLKFYDSWYDDVADRARPIAELPIPAELTDPLAIRSYRDAKRLAYKATSLINWCPKDKIGLANEEAEGGVCERCGTPVEKREKSQWMIRMTTFAERLLKDLDDVDYPDKIKSQQVNWIGKSEGAEVDFLVPLFDKVLFATNNRSKIERARRLLAEALPATALLTPSDAGLETVEVAEGDDLIANARLKLSAYIGKTDLPLLGADTGFYIAGEKIDPAKVKRNALNGDDEHQLSQQEISERMQRYYQDIAARHGGQVDAYWKDVFVLRLPDGQERVSESIRPVTLTDRSHGPIDPYFPLRSLCVVKASGKTAAEQTPAEERLELAPMTQALAQLLAKKITVFTTRIDTIFSGTYLVLAPEHPLLPALTRIDQRAAVEAYVQQAVNRSEAQRSDMTKEKTGVFTGTYAINPASGGQMPIWVSDFVLGGYGSGAVFADAHDQRDFEMAKKFGLPLKASIRPTDEDLWRQVQALETCYSGDGVLVHSGAFDGLTSAAARPKIRDWLGEMGLARTKTQYKLGDWVFSRQHYWGEPIPMIQCHACGFVPVPDDQLPVTLPEVEAYEPTDNGESPLAKIRSWVEVRCPACGGPAERETDTMPSWAGSSWYFLRYADPHNDQALASPESLKKWLPVDLYIGGMEHTTRHLLYSRFWHKLLWDLKLIPQECGPEPYRARRSQRLILAEGGEKMSKSKGNVVNPDDVIARYGADVFRVYIMFIGPFDQDVPWDTNGIEGVRRFLDKVWQLYQQPVVAATAELTTRYHQTVKKLTEGIPSLQFNTCISQLMIFVNACQDQASLPIEFRQGLLQLLAPFAPHLTEELWQGLGQVGSIHHSTWPSFDPQELQAAEVEIVIQVNGKLRDRLRVDATIAEADLTALALASAKVQPWTAGKSPSRMIYVPGTLLNIVTE